MASAAETEIASSFINAQEAMPSRYAVEFLGHKKPRTPMQVDNTTVVGFNNDTIKQKTSKDIDMRFYWLRHLLAPGSAQCGRLVNYFFFTSYPCFKKSYLSPRR